MPPATTPDTRPLTERLSRGQAKRFLAERGRTRTGGRSGVIWLTGSIAGTLLGLVLVVLSWNPPGSDALLIVGAVVACICAPLILVGAVMLSSGDPVRIARLTRFAEANGMHFDGRPGLITLTASSPGMIFAPRFLKRRSTDIVSATHPRQIEFGTHSYEEPGSDSRRHWGYIAVRLDAPLPHIVLDAASNNRMGRSNLPLVFPDARELSLEGDFPTSFRLLCPPGYEHDAYFLFTPDVMARFVDNAARVDVEIVDDWLFFYIDGRRATPVDPDEWAWMFTLVAAMDERIERWGRWRDDRLEPTHDAPVNGSAVPVVRPPVGVADAGGRLRRRKRFSLSTIIGGIIGVGFVLLFLFAWGADTFG